MSALSDRLAQLELAVSALSYMVFVSGAGDDAQPTDLIVGSTIHTGKHKDHVVTAVHKDANGDLLGAELRHLYSGRTTLLDPSEDVTGHINDDTDTAQQTGVRSLSGQGPRFRPHMAPYEPEKDSLRQPEDKK